MTDDQVVLLTILRRIRAGWLPHSVGPDRKSWWWGRPRSGDGFFSWSTGWTPSMSVVEPMTDAEIRVWVESLDDAAPERPVVPTRAGEHL